MKMSYFAVSAGPDRVGDDGRRNVRSDGMGATDDEKRRRFEVLIVEHHVQLRAFVRSLGVDADWVDDVAQEAFLTAYCEWDSFDRSRDFGKWLRGIAANIVRNEVRKRARRHRLLYTELAEILLRREADLRASGSPEPMTIEAVRRCLGKLTVSHRELVQARYRDGDSAPEIADRFELTPANVRQMLVRIRRQVKDCVESQMLKGAENG